MNCPAPRSAAAVRSLFRIRAFEEAADAAGLRRVWHRGEGGGADLLTWVSSDGKVARQELTLLDDHFVWTPNGLRTARLEAGEGLEGEAASVRFDKLVSLQRAFAALAALRGYSGDDKYILHIQRILAKAVGELMGADELVMTRDLHIPCTSERTLALWAGAAVALAALAAAFLALLG
jgi:hypothetical protein